jgi:hypothetical protein
MKWRYAGLLLIGLIAVQGCAEKRIDSGQATLMIKSIGDTKTERFKFTKGTPLGILEYNHTVKTFLNDNFVECIDGVCASKEYIWLLYVNDNLINYGAKRYSLEDGDIVTFSFEKSSKGGK